MLRQLHETWWSLGRPAGRLSLTPRPVTLADKANPSFLAHRLQHAKFTASTALDVPATPGVSAGLAILQNEVHHYFLGVHRTADGLELFLELANGRPPTIVARTKLPETAQLGLRVTGDEGVLAFDYAVKPGAWQTLVPAAETLPVTVQAAGGGLHFTGAVIGLHARLEP
jgi:alpha-N-arabinofuranosidase